MSWTNYKTLRPPTEAGRDEGESEEEREEEAEKGKYIIEKKMQLGEEAAGNLELFTPGGLLVSSLPLSTITAVTQSC